MSPFLKVVLWLALPVAVCVWAVAHGQPAEILAACDPGTVRSDAHGHVYCITTRAEPTRPDIPGAALTDDVRKICRRGYSASVRPLERYTEAYKQGLLVMEWHGQGPDNLESYQLDHLLPLELGGSNDFSNLWLQPIGEAKLKDIEENRIHREVCAGRIDIHDAQRYFLHWPDGTLQ